LKFAQQIGRDILLQEIFRHKLTSSVLEGENIRLILEILNVRDLQELYVQIGQDLVSPQLVLYYLEGHRPDDSKKRAEEGYDQNTLSVSNLDKAIFKFARCCNPLPGQDHVVATLSERGVTFHHSDCQDLHERHSILVQQMLQVYWDPNTAWRHPLVFRVQILERSIKDLLPALAGMPTSIGIQRIDSGRDKHGQEFVYLSAAIHNFAEAKQFFDQLQGQKAIIEDFDREGGQRSVQV
jgi:GTP pyrophosphokinase